MARFFATFSALLASLSVLMLAMVQLVNGTSLLLDAWTMGATLLAIAVGTYFVFSATRILALAYAVRLLRGPGAVAWSAPSTSRSLSLWLACTWDYYGNQGRQRGERFLGIEVALEGRLA